MDSKPPYVIVERYSCFTTPRKSKISLLVPLYACYFRSDVDH